MSLEDEKLKGKKFGRLTVIRAAGKDKCGNTIFKFKCDCGVEKDILLANVKSGKTKSCGCLNKELIIERNFKHGLSKTSEHVVWKNMKARCYNPNDKGYKNYGGRGIIVCDRWLNKESGFMDFYGDMGKRPGKKYSIDRINNSGNYEPNNCKWNTRTEQNRNRRDNHMIAYNGETKCVSAWAEELGISRKILLHRIYKFKWDIGDVFEMLIDKRRRL